MQIDPSLTLSLSLSAISPFLPYSSSDSLLSRQSNVALYQTLVLLREHRKANKTKTVDIFHLLLLLCTIFGTKAYETKIMFINICII